MRSEAPLFESEDIKANGAKKRRYWGPQVVSIIRMIIILIIFLVLIWKGITPTQFMEALTRLWRFL
jgi:hypothetical protein